MMGWCLTPVSVYNTSMAVYILSPLGAHTGLDATTSLSSLPLSYHRHTHTHESWGSVRVGTDLDDRPISRWYIILSRYSIYICNQLFLMKHVSLLAVTPSSIDDLFHVPTCHVSFRLPPLQVTWLFAINPPLPESWTQLNTVIRRL